VQRPAPAVPAAPTPPTPPRPASNGVATAPRVGLGNAFQPIPGAQIVRAPTGDGVARVPAHAGTPVHAVIAGIVVHVDGQGAVGLRGTDGRQFAYTGLDPASVTVRPGAAVGAGDILGAVGAQVLELRLTGPDGEPLDAAEALLGLADPNELGYVPVGSGLGVDPDAMDREIVAAGLPGPGGPPR
jgi:murein DD-endopeptidase MepM/ murein hydrolase activator NlpD